MIENLIYWLIVLVVVIVIIVVLFHFLGILLVLGGTGLVTGVDIFAVTSSAGSLTPISTTV
jgi:hypothetical protein